MVNIIHCTWLNLQAIMLTNVWTFISSSLVRKPWSLHWKGQICKVIWMEIFLNIFTCVAISYAEYLQCTIFHLFYILLLDTGELFLGVCVCVYWCCLAVSRKELGVRLLVLPHVNILFVLNHFSLNFYNYCGAKYRLGWSLNCSKLFCKQSVLAKLNNIQKQCLEVTNVIVKNSLLSTLRS